MADAPPHNFTLQKSSGRTQTNCKSAQPSVMTFHPIFLELSQLLKKQQWLSVNMRQLGNRLAEPSVQSQNIQSPLYDRLELITLKMYET